MAKRKYSDEDILQALRSAGYLTPREWDSRHLKPCARLIIRRLGWLRAYDLAGVDLAQARRERLLAPLRERGKFTPYTQLRHDHNMPSLLVYERTFGGWRAAWRAAGVAPSPYPSDPKEMPGFDRLPERIRIVLSRRHAGDTLAEIGHDLGVTREVIRRLSNRGWRILTKGR